MKTRKEKDALGEVEVPIESYGGSFYTRANANFQISDLKASPFFMQALVQIKRAAARVNRRLGILDQERAEAIEKAAMEVLDGAFAFDLDIYQAGAGTPFNMHMNEILANRANELCGGEKGVYKPVHPNDHVNLCQSSNDVIPATTRVAALLALPSLILAGRDLIHLLEDLAQKNDDLLKVGRTHLQDAVPIRVGQEFGAFAESLKNALKRLESAQAELTFLGLGGTATGSGINAHPHFAKEMCTELSELTGLDLKTNENRFESTNSMAPLLALSSALRGLATELLRLGNDLRLLSSGPRAGLNEWILPEVEPGSSIMPGKVNPSVPECLCMICWQVIALDQGICLGAQSGELQLNWATPLIQWNLLHQIQILGNGMKMLNRDCLSGLKVNEEKLKRDMQGSTALATVLVPHLGYAKVAQLVHEALDKKLPFEEVVPEEYRKYLEPRAMTEPNLLS